jgi:hypothetical protein
MVRRDCRSCRRNGERMLKGFFRWRWVRLVLLVSAAPSLWLLAIFVSDHSKYDQIRKGMTAQEVEAVFGPCRNVQGNPATGCLFEYRGPGLDRITIRFDTNRAVEKKWIYFRQPGLYEEVAMAVSKFVYEKPD